jgi:DNA-directed RNA polymerase specialized sigma24 family protein
MRLHIRTRRTSGVLDPGRPRRRSRRRARGLLACVRPLATGPDDGEPGGVALPGCGEPQHLLATAGGPAHPRNTPDRSVEPEPSSDPALADALRRLAPAQRAAVVLRFYLDMSVEAAAQALGKKPGTIRALTSQGIARLREDLGSEWMEEADERMVP